MLRTTLYFAWWWLLAGLLAGAVQGMWFHRSDWLGGYGSWPRRMTRLGHVAFVGTALINLGFALSASELSLEPAAVRLPALLLVLGAVTMPAVCYLAAWKRPFRHLFFVPVATLVLGVATFIVTAMRDGVIGG